MDFAMEKKHNLNFRRSFDYGEERARERVAGKRRLFLRKKETIRSSIFKLMNLGAFTVIQFQRVLNPYWALLFFCSCSFWMTKYIIELLWWQRSF